MTGFKQLPIPSRVKGVGSMKPSRSLKVRDRRMGSWVCGGTTPEGDPTWSLGPGLGSCCSPWDLGYHNARCPHLGRPLKMLWVVCIRVCWNSLPRMLASWDSWPSLMRAEVQHRAPQPLTHSWPWFIWKTDRFLHSCCSPRRISNVSFGFGWSLCLWCHPYFLLLCLPQTYWCQAPSGISALSSVVQEFWKGTVGTALLCFTISRSFS